MPIVMLFVLLASLLPLLHHHVVQQPPPDLVVTVRDAQGTPLPQLTVIVRDASADGAIATQTTDGSRQVIFASLPVSAVRVQLHGTLRSGTALYQPGEDRDGIALLLGPAPNRLDLVVEDDGLVRPDPQTMLAPDAAGAPINATTPASSPTTIRAPQPALPATVIVPTTDSGADGAVADEDTPTAVVRWWLVLAMLATIVTFVFVISLWLQRAP